MDAYTPFAAVGALVAGVVFLTVFFTLWERAKRKLNGDPMNLELDLKIEALKDRVVHVQFKGGARIQNVRLLGYCSTHQEAPYEFRQLLILRDERGKRYFARIAEIQFFESAEDEGRVEALPSSSPSPGERGRG